MPTKQSDFQKPGIRYSAANAWSAGVPRTDANGNQIYVNNLGQQVDAAAEGAMPAYKLPYEEYTPHGSTLTSLQKIFRSTSPYLQCNNRLQLANKRR